MKLSPRVAFALGLIGPVLLVAAAVVLTVVYHVAACPLCIVQRMLYLLVALAALIGLLGLNSLLLHRGSALLMMSASVVGAAIAAYQIYLQRNPFTATCGDGTAWWERLVDRAGQALPMLFKADGLCSESTWSLLGLSIVELSLLAYSGLFVLGVIALFLRRK